MLIKVKVKTHSGEQAVENLSENMFSVKLKESPENGKANLELIKILSKYFKKKVKIKSGFTSRNKVVEIEE